MLTICIKIWQVFKLKFQIPKFPLDLSIFIDTSPPFSINDYPWNRCLSLLKLWVHITLRRGVLDMTLCDKVYRWFATGRWFSPSTPVSSTNKTDLHDITEILLKVAVHPITLTPSFSLLHLFLHMRIQHIIL